MLQACTLFCLFLLGFKFMDEVLGYLDLCTIASVTRLSVPKISYPESFIVCVFMLYCLCAIQSGNAAFLKR